ncbi:MAG: polymer-forming cytoskeletal protein [Bacteroidetes bacterium]|nr:polymer-forming cytoskeletal protein [Bacteroidota bacterium]MBP6412937.1 polymer-forming cytoskeletal protein [Bacteroidia bacterium]MBK9671214.1 polymer-forming cytoskeletal protein [Bacteroidota bacterium]MBK9798879.1 polymer-forming cytoskeletal protein [Bacteroidota bacterium]HRH02192.1 polymer-forming cytoskeletal protein [Bacteroidia bacterium]
MGKNSDLNSSINLIGAGTVINGEVISNGDIRVDGTVIGSVSSKGKVVIGTTGNIEGEIVCQNADVSGKISGNISVAEILSLKASANLVGDIIASKLSIEPGANFMGSCSMGGTIKNMLNADKQEREKAEKIA